MKKSLINKKGFTLVELLAVIVILAIIALIAVPITLNVLEDSKKSSIKVGTTHYIDTLEDELQYDNINLDEISSGMYLVKKDGTLEVNGEEKELEMKGNLPENGVICVNEDGLVESYSVVLDGYVVTNTNGTQKIEAGTAPKSLTCNVAEETVEIVIPENAAVCSQDKKVEINYPEYEEVAKEYSLDRETWKEYTGVITLDKNTTLYARLRDTRNNKISSVATHVFTTIDNTKMTKISPSVVLSSEKPTSQIEVTFRQTDNCGVDESTIKYGISTTKDGEYKWQDSAIFSGLKNNTTYFIKTKVNDIANNGTVESEISEITTKNFGTCNIDISDYGKWTPSKNVTITGETISGTTLQYKVYKASISDDSGWIDTTSGVKFNIDTMSISEAPTTITCRYVEKNEKEEIINTLDPAISKNIVTIDTTNPALILGVASASTNSVTIPISLNEDEESGIKETVCKYGTSSGSYSKTGTISDGKCILEKLSNNTTYYYQIITTNNAGTSTTKTGSAKTGDFATVEITQNTKEWTTSKTIKITGSTSGSKLQYQLNSTKGEWIDIDSGDTITITSNATIYARLWDGTNSSSVANLTVTTIDTTAPELTLGPATVTTKSITIPINVNKDEESGIKNTTCKYGTSSGSYTSTGTVSNGKCTISNVKNGTTYYYQVVTTNASGISTTKTGSTKTGEFAGITITPNSTSWTTSKTVTISGTTSGATLQYRVVSGTTVKKDWTTYSNAITINWTATSTTPTYVYARFSDGVNYSNQESLTITTVDTTAPELILGTATVSTKSITIPINVNTDNESGISGTTCKYGTSEGSYTSTGTISNGKCTISNVKNGTDYYYQITTTNGAGTSTKVTGSTKTGEFGGITLTASSSEWKPSKTVTISGSTNGATLQYKIVSGTTVKKDWTTYSSAITVNWVATTTTPTYVYARFYDGVNYSNQTSLTLTKVDSTAASTTAPTVAASTTNPTKAAVVTIKQADSESGIASKEYGYSTSSTGTYTWGTSSTISGLTQGGTYYFKTRVKNGAGTGWTESAASTAYKVTAMTNCSISMSNAGKWATSKTATITGSQTGVNLQYRVVSGTTEKVAWTTVSSGKTQTINWAANTTTPTYVYCRMTDGTTTVNGTTYTETYIDTTAASTTVPTLAASTTNPTKAVVVTLKQADGESGIASKEYGYSTSSTGTYTWQTSNTITGLTQGGSYFIKTRVKNGAGTGWTESAASTAYKVTAMTNCSISMSNAGKWATSKTATITGSQTGVTLQYRVVSGTTEKVAWTTVSSGKTQTINWAANTTTPTYVYCRMTDGTTTVNGTTYTETYIDTTAASTTVPTLAASTTNPTKAVVVTLKQTDGESGIASKEYGYSTSSTGTYTWQTSSTITGLTQGGTYYFKTRVKNGAGTGWTETAAVPYSPTKISSCLISMNTSNWAASKTATITGSQTGVTLQYRVVSGTTEKVAWTTVSSGKTQTINWAANTTTPTYVYCRMTDGTTTVNGTTYTETKVDITAASTTAPTSVASTTNPTKAAVITNKQADGESGIASIQYGYSTSASGTYTWQTSSTITGLTQGKTYYLKTRVKNGAGTGWTESSYVQHAVPAMTPCSISMSNAGVWKTSKTATITGSQTGVTLQYRVVSGTTEKVAWTTVSSGKTQTINWAANTTTPTYVYCRMTDGTTTVNGTTYTETTVDPTAASTTAPTVTASTTNPTKAAVVTLKQADGESGIASKEYGYSTSSTGTYTWGTSSTISGLTQGGTYYFKTRVKNGAGTGWTESSATSYKVTAMTNCSISMSNAGVWKTSKTATITGSQTGVTLQYRVVSGTTEKVAWTTVSSGATKTIDWAANTTTPTYVYCRMTDGTTTVNGTTYTETTIDRTAPGTASSTIRIGSSTGTVRANTTAWTNQTLWWGSFTATDTGGSGVSYYQYSNGCTGTSSGTLSASYTYSSNVNYTFCIRAVDAAGNAGAWSGAYYIKIDKTAPPTPSSVIRTGSSSGATRSNSSSWTKDTIWWGSFSSTDTGGSGTSSYQYSSGCTGTSSGTLSASYTYSSTRNSTFCIRAVDAAGNASAWSGAYYFKIDKTAPTCGSWSGGSTSWAKSRTIQVTCSDGHSGCAASAFTKSYTTTTTTATVSIGIKDAVGNTATCTYPSAVSIYVDTTAPTCGSWSGGGSSWTKSNRSVSVGCSDSHSGCAATSYSVTYSSTTKTATPSTTIKDKAGNSRTCTGSSMNIYVDKTAPTITMTPAAGTYYSGNTVAVSCSDAHSGMVSSTGAYLEDLNYVTKGTSSTSQTLATTGTRTATGKCTDNVGNVSTATRKYTINYAPPSTCKHLGWTCEYCNSIGGTCVSGTTSCSNCNCQYSC